MKISAALLLAGCLLACGSTNGGSGSTGPSADGGSALHNVQIHVAGSGQVSSSAFTCATDCTQQVADGQTIHLVATAASGFKFDGWSGDCAGGGACDLTVTADRSIAAAFSTVVTPPGNVQVTVSLQGAGTGRVTSSPGGIDCPGTCSLAVAAGTPITLSAAATPNSTLAGFGGACSGASCAFVANADSTVYVNFTANPPPPPAQHALNVTLAGQGHVTSTPAGLDCSGATCSAQFPAGTQVSLAASPAAGWTFSGWSGACSGSGACTVTLSSDVQVGATFAAPPPPPADAHVIVTVTGRGQVTANGINCGSGANACDTTVPVGTVVTLQESAASQARFMGWSGPCTGNASSCTFTATGEVKVTATFQDILTTLVANDGTNEQALAINSTDVFYSRSTAADGGSVWAVSKTGGQPRRVASGLAYTLVADDSYVYWADYYAVYSAPVAGGSASQIFAGSEGIQRLALDAQGSLYFTARNYSSTGEVHRLHDRTDTVLASNVNFVQPGIAADDTDVYFGSIASGSNDGLLQRVPKAGGAVATVIDCGYNCPIVSLKTDSANVYVRSATGPAWSVSKTHPALVLLSGPNAGGNGYFYNAEVDAWGSVVYWNWLNSSSTAQNGIFSAAADGKSWTAIDTGSDYAWYGPRVDDTAMYYWHSGALLRRLK